MMVVAIIVWYSRIRPLTPSWRYACVLLTFWYSQLGVVVVFITAMMIFQYSWTLYYWSCCIRYWHCDEHISIVGILIDHYLLWWGYSRQTFFILFDVVLILYSNVLTLTLVCGDDGIRQPPWLTDLPQHLMMTCVVAVPTLTISGDWLLIWPGH